MAGEHPKSGKLQIPDRNDVIIIGAGPVGLVASLLLSKYHVPHVLVEQLAKPDNHPQAHFINCRSMEILREIGRLDQTVYMQSAPPDEWRRFVYCTSLADLPALGHSQQKLSGSLLGVVDHFANAPDVEYSPGRVVHFPQHDLVRLLRKAALNSRFCTLVEGYRAEIEEQHAHVDVFVSGNRNSRRRHVKTQYVVAADGAHSTTRKQLGIKLNSDTGTLQHLINVHFISTQLAENLRTRIPAMLYFVYSSAGVAVLVAHSFKRGEFVAQIPYFPPYQQIEDFDKTRCTGLLQKLAGQNLPIDIRSIRSWRMGTWQASRYRSKWGRCFLIGDAAHQFTPAGGFGMNTGIQDAHNLIWKMVMTLRSERSAKSISAERLLATFEDERRPVAQMNSKLSVANYIMTLHIPSAIGLHLSMANRLNSFFNCLPGLHGLKRVLFQSVMRLGLKQVNWLKSDHPIIRYRRRVLRGIFNNVKDKTLQLLFPGQDMGFVYGKGWLFGPKTETRSQIDPFVFKPELRVGGRVPHFWLADSKGQQFSVLDLPSMMIGTEGHPKCVMLQAGKMMTAELKFNTIADLSFTTVQISQSRSSKRANFSYHLNRPEFLPKSFAMLIRPDGHIAWLQMDSSLD